MPQFVLHVLLLGLSLGLVAGFLLALDEIREEQGIVVLSYQARDVCAHLQHAASVLDRSDAGVLSVQLPMSLAGMPYVIILSNTSAAIIAGNITSTCELGNAATGNSSGGFVRLALVNNTITMS